jgi:hypothetical protein
MCVCTCNAGADAGECEYGYPCCCPGLSDRLGSTSPLPPVRGCLRRLLLSAAAVHAAIFPLIPVCPRPHLFPAPDPAPDPPAFDALDKYPSESVIAPSVAGPRRGGKGGGGNTLGLDDADRSDVELDPPARPDGSKMLMDALLRFSEPAS